MDRLGLLRAEIAARPDDDFLRLVYADAVEESGDAEYAAFVHTQFAIAPLAPWHPLAVTKRWHAPKESQGTFHKAQLPPPGTKAWEWAGHQNTFVRGLPGRVIVRSLTAFLDCADELFARYPVVELELPTVTRAEWQRFVRAPWYRQLRSLTFYGLSTPIEALRVMAESEPPADLRELILQKFGGPAIPVLMDEVLPSPFGRQVTSLKLVSRSDGDSDWIEALGRVGPDHRLTELSLTNLGMTFEQFRELRALPLWPRLTRFASRHNNLFDPNANWDSDERWPLTPRLESWTDTEGLKLGDLARARPPPTAPSLARLAGRVNSKSLIEALTAFPQLRSFKPSQILNGLQTPDYHVRVIDQDFFHSPFWQRAVEVDLIGLDYAHELVDMLASTDPGSELRALVLSQYDPNDARRAGLLKRYPGVIAFV